MDECVVPREGDLEAAFARILLGTPCLPDDTPNPEMVRLPLVYVAPLFLFHPLFVALFLSPGITWHLLAVKVQARAIAHRVGPFMEWLLGVHRHLSKAQ